MAYTPPWNLIGQTVSGDFADLTIYTDRFNQKVFYPKAPPKEPPTIRQINQRSRFALAVKSYVAEPDDVKANYETATKAQIVRAPIVCKPSPVDEPPTALATLVPDVLELSVNTTRETELTITDPGVPDDAVITLTYTTEDGLFTGPPDMLNNTSTTLEYLAPIFAGNFQLKVVGRYPDGTIVIVFGLAIVVTD